MALVEAKHLNAYEKCMLFVFIMFAIKKKAIKTRNMKTKTMENGEEQRGNASTVNVHSLVCLCLKVSNENAKVC